MARTTIKATYRDRQTTNQRIASILQSHNYKAIQEHNENVWKCGVGFWTAMKYVKIEFAADNTILISGWIRSIVGSEQNLEGFFGALPKKQVMNVIKEIQAAIV